MSKTKHYDEREEYAKTPWGNLKARNPEGVEANTSGDRQDEAHFHDHNGSKVYYPKGTNFHTKPSSKGESAHTPDRITPLSTTHEYVRNLERERDKLREVLGQTSARDLARLEDLREQLRELLAACQSVANGPRPESIATMGVWIDTVRQLAGAAIKHTEGEQ